MLGCLFSGNNPFRPYQEIIELLRYARDIEFMDTEGMVSFFRCKKLLQAGGVFASSDLGFLAQNLYLPMLAPLLKLLFGKRYTIFPMPVDIKRSLLLLQKLMASNEFKPLIDREYPLDDIVAAYQYVAQGSKRGNVVILISS